MTRRTRGSSGTGIDEVRREIAADGVMVAYRSLKQVCQDVKAPAQARAAAGVAIFRAGGLFDAKKAPTSTDEVPELSGDQIREIMAALQAEHDQLEASMSRKSSVNAAAIDEDDDETDLDLFG